MACATGDFPFRDASLSSRTETCGLNETNLVAASREFTTLVALHDHTTARFDTDNAGTNPAKSGGFENLHDITRLKIQLHAENRETARGGIGRAVEDSNPRHQVLETCVLPTELTAQGDGPLSQHTECWQLD